MSKLKNLISGHFTILKMIYLYIFFLATKRDTRLKQYKNKHLNKRCFVIGLGPSLKISDLETLRSHNEVCFSVNRIYELYSKTKWRPDYYYISDKTATTSETKDNIENMLHSKESDVLYSQYSFREMPAEAVACKVFNVYTPLHNTKNRFLKQFDKPCEFSTNAYKRIYDGMSCILAVIQLAYFMGFKEVYLLGCDCGSSNGEEYGEGLKKRDRSYYNAKDSNMLLEDYEFFANDMKRKKIDMKVYNATRGGALESFERVNFDELFYN